MTRSIFDPTGPNTERSGGTFVGPDAANSSQMPEAAVDGVDEGAAERDGVNQASSDLIDMEPQTESPTLSDPKNKVK